MGFDFVLFGVLVLGTTFNFLRTFQTVAKQNAAVLVARYPVRCLGNQAQGDLGDASPVSKRLRATLKEEFLGRGTG